MGELGQGSLAIGLPEGGIAQQELGTTGPGHSELSGKSEGGRQGSLALGEHFAIAGPNFPSAGVSKFEGQQEIWQGRGRSTQGDDLPLNLHAANADIRVGRLALGGGAGHDQEIVLEGDRELGWLTVWFQKPGGGQAWRLDRWRNNWLGRLGPQARLLARWRSCLGNGQPCCAHNRVQDHLGHFMGELLEICIGGLGGI